MKKKILLIMLLVLSMLVSLVSCKDGEDSKDNEEPDTDVGTTEDTVKKGIAFELSEGASVDVGKTTLLKVINLETGKQTSNLFWSSDNEEILTVDSKGNITGVAQGSAKITATTFDGKYTAECNVSVVLRLSGVQLNFEDYDLEVGDSVQLVASAMPDSFIGATYTWLSSVPEVASVDENGLVTAHKLGNASIMVSAEPGGHTAICSISVGKYADSITLEYEELTINRGVDHQLTLTMLPADATTRPHWRSSDESVAIVNSGGVITAKKVGETVITVSTTNGLSASCKVTVISTLNGFEFAQGEITVSKRSETEPDIIYYPEDATNKEIIWSSSDESVVSVVEGMIIAYKNGTVTLTAESVDGGYIQTLIVNVNNPLLSIEFEGEKDATSGKYPTITLPCTDSLKPNVTYTPFDADEIPLLEWTSSNSNVVSVSSDGTLLAHNIGTATITVTSPNGITVSFDVDVIKKVYPVKEFYSLSDVYYVNVNDLLSIDFHYIPEEAKEDAMIGNITVSNPDVAIWELLNSAVLAKAVGECEIEFTIVNQDLSVVKCKILVKVVEDETEFDDEYRSDTHALRDEFNSRFETLNDKLAALKAREAELLELIRDLEALISSGETETLQETENPGDGSETTPPVPEVDPNKVLLEQYRNELVQVRVDIKQTETDMESLDVEREQSVLGLSEKYKCVMDEITYDPDSDPYPEKYNDELVNAGEYIDNLTSDLKYASDNNEIGKKIYDFTDAYLRYGTVKKLAKVASFFGAMDGGGYKIVVIDAYRPVAAQNIIWDILGTTDRSYGAFCEGRAVCIMLVNPDGSAVDDADGGLAMLLELQMTTNGFTALDEDGCFVDNDAYDLEEEFLSDKVIVPKPSANVTLEYGEDKVPADPDSYVSYEDTEASEKNAVLVFKTDIDITYFKFHKVDPTSGEIVSDALCVVNSFEIAMPIVIRTYINDAAENRAISYVDSDGETKYFLIKYNGVDGSLSLEEASE